VLLSFPVGFLLVFCAKYVVVIIRNYQVVAPFLCVLAARGIGDVMERLRPRWARWTFAALLATTGVIQAVWLIRAGESIRHIDPTADVRHALDYVARHPNTRFRLSDRVRAFALGHELALPSNVVTAPDGQQVVMFGKADMFDSERYRTNDPWLTIAQFGPREVNFDWYSVWGGHDRVLIMTIEKARDSALPFAR
jgi:hypothetical protein